MLAKVLTLNKIRILKLKLKDEVTLPSPGVLFWLILITVFPIHFYGCRFLTQIQDLGGVFFFCPPTEHCRIESEKKCVCSGGKLRKSSQVLRKVFFKKINQNYFAHIYSFRVKYPLQCVHQIRNDYNDLYNYPIRTFEKDHKQYLKKKKKKTIHFSDVCNYMHGKLGPHY